MKTLFMPSCNNSVIYERSISRLERYLLDRGLVDGFTGCCKATAPGCNGFTEGANIVAICNTCSAIAEESLGGKLTNALELILADPDFKYPDYHGEEIAVQDCCRCRGRHELHDTVRELLKKMNMTPVELEENRDDSKFCGVSTFDLLPNNVRELAPKRFRALEGELFTPHTEEEKRAAMVAHVLKIHTSRVVSYCFSCDMGLKVGGADSAALINLLFDDAI